jgi:formylglycine-generating enzyme required for sulfatase activity
LVSASEPEVDRVGDVLLAETKVGEYRIRSLIGEGSIGQVYLAQDIVLGRRVALKVIKRSMMRGDGLERFLDEARATARFSHPHIVTLHAVGEHDGRPFLALEFIDGESLRARLAAGPLPVREALRIVRAITEALTEAHRHGLVHADLKPENVVIPPDGRLRVVDFGLARLVGATSDSASGTPAYMAPERWRGESPRGAIDVWALGILLHEVITGVRPIADTELAQLAYATPGAPMPYLPNGAGWSTLVGDCLALDAAARPTAEQVGRRLGNLLDPRAALDDAERCPFPGLAAFARDDAAAYFGRRRELDAIVEKLRTHPLVPIVGPSGVGKSSFVYAALIPRLDEAGPWSVCTLRPGPAPFRSLAAALGDGPPEELAETLLRRPEALSLVLSGLAERRRGRVLVFLDQFEEAFTLAGAQATAFAECVALAALADEPWRIVLTVRDDFFGRLAESPAMRTLLGAVMLLAPLSAADLSAAVLGPLANAAYAPDAPDLVERIVADVQHQPACLPLLQFTCRQLWDRRDRVARRIVSAEYDAIGGASGALATHAQQLLAQLSAVQVGIARKVLLALVNPDGTRQPRLRSELLAELPPEAADVVERLLEGRLVVAGREAEADEGRLEVAHESLATAWPQLARWLDETHEERLLLAELEQAAQLWSRRGRLIDETWTGAALGEAIRKVSAWNLSLPGAARLFLEAGRERQRRSRGRRRWLAGGIASALGVATVIAAGAAVAFARKEQQALAQQAEIRLAGADMGAFELALEPYDWDHVQQHQLTPSRLPPLQWRLRAVDPDDRHKPGRFYTDGDLRRGVPGWDAVALIEVVEARSGPAYLEVSGRGGGCAGSLLYLQHIPGYAERQVPPWRLRISVPTCQASTADMVEIPAGEFYRNVNQGGEATPRDELASLRAFAIDRTEVTRGAFASYERMNRLTGGDSAAPDDYLERLEGGAPRQTLPIVGVSYHTAMSYCQYHGKTLPTIDQWQKAFRGGLSIGDRPNTDPRRMTPWLATAVARPTNLRPRSGTGAPAPVGSYPADASPYGVVDLAGNVAEWSLSPANEPRLRAVLGGSWNIPVDQQSDRITWRNSRAEIAISYEIGFRCTSRGSDTP